MNNLDRSVVTDGQMAAANPNGVQTSFNDNGVERAVSTAHPNPVLLPAVTTTVLTIVNASATPATILALNTNRKGVSIFNNSSVNLYIDESGGTPGSSRYTVKIPPQTLWEMPLPVSAVLISGIWDSATGFANVKECS